MYNVFDQVLAVIVEILHLAGFIGSWKKKQRAGKVRYDFVQRDAEGQLHIYYGVTEEGLHGERRRLVEEKR